MAFGRASQIRWEPCRLVAAPTSLAGSYPFGGTEIGLFKNILWSEGIEVNRLKGEEFGGATIGTGVRVADGGAFLACAARGWDADLAGMLPGGNSGGSGTVASSYNQSPLLTQRVLLLVPESDRIAGTKNRGIAKILYAATLLPAASDRVAHSYGREFIRPMIWMAELDSTGRDFADGKIEDLSL